MNSRDKLTKLANNFYKETMPEYDSMQYFKDIDEDLEKLEQYEKIFNEPLIEIRKRLEILDMLKQEFHIKLYNANEISYKAYLITIQSYEDEGTWDTTAETTITKEQYDKLKEWLKNEKTD